MGVQGRLSDLDESMVHIEDILRFESLKIHFEGGEVCGREEIVDYLDDQTLVLNGQQVLDGVVYLLLAFFHQFQDSLV